MKNKSKFKFVIIMMIFGTIGVVSHFIPLSSATIVFYRAILAAIEVVIVSFLTKRKYDLRKMREKFSLLILIGIFLGLNWVFQFEAFRLASVSVGTVCYNTMPMFVILLSPIWFKDKLTNKNVFCLFLSMIGVVLVSNVIYSGFKIEELSGCFFGLVAALFYALTVMINKHLSDIECYDKITIEFFVSSIIMIPYIIFSKNCSFDFSTGITFNEYIVGVICLLTLAFVHTGGTYMTYFKVVNEIKPHDIAILTYIDPMVALLLSAIILKEKLNALQIIGAGLILASTLLNEANDVKIKKDG